MLCESTRCQNGNETNVVLMWSESHCTNMRTLTAIICLIPCVHLNGPFRTSAPRGSCRNDDSSVVSHEVDFYVLHSGSITRANEVDKRCPSSLSNLILQKRWDWLNLSFTLIAFSFKANLTFLKCIGTFSHYRTKDKKCVQSKKHHYSVRSHYKIFPPPLNL